MSGKTLSTSTLSLKFMQNAHRAKNLKEVELEKAPVKDDGEWEVSKEVIAAWGEAEPAQSVSYESSYLPFLFPSFSTPEPSTDSMSGQNFKGRRVFKKGKEIAVVAEPETPPTASSSQDSPGSPTARGARATRPLTKLRPTGSISGSSNLKRDKPSKSAREAIYDNSGVGSDLRSSRSLAGPSDEPHPHAPPVFLKPSGVDDPNMSKNSLTSNDVIDGARTVASKVKRVRTSSDQLDGAGSKSKKKRKSGD